MNKINLKQGSLKWEAAKADRIGGSEVFDIVKYYSTDDELQNCGIDAESFRTEKPYTTVWALYHKLLKDGLYERESLPPELSEYGHAVEPYGLSVLQEGRRKKLKRGEVYISDRLIASLDISGISETADVLPFDYGNGIALEGKRFVCEQKTLMPNVLKRGLPVKYIIQAQYQITMTKADFFILQLMVLDKDTAFERGRIVQMSQKKRREYLRDKMKISHLYFQNNEHLAALIKACTERFFYDVDNGIEPTPFIEYDSRKNIIESIRINSFYKKDLALDYELDDCIKAKAEGDLADAAYKSALQSIVEAAKRFNAVNFISKDGTRGSFSKDGKFLIKAPKEG